MWLLTASFAVPLVLALTALMGVPYGVVSIASSQGMYVSTQPQERGWPPGSSRPAATSARSPRPC